MTESLERPGVAEQTSAAPGQPHPAKVKRGCRCAKCKAYNVAKNTEYRRRRAYRDNGVAMDCDLVDARHSRELIENAVARGMSYGEIVRLTGCNRDTIMQCCLGKRKKIQRRNEMKIHNALADIDKRALLPTTLIPITVEPQIVRSLMAQGWSVKHLQYILENNNQGSGFIVEAVLKKNQKHALAKNLKKIRWLAKAIGDKTGPSAQTADRMRARGIFPLRHYDAEGKIIERTLNKQQLAAWQRVQSKHGATTGSDHSDGSHP